MISVAQRAAGQGRGPPSWGWTGRCWGLGVGSVGREVPDWVKSVPRARGSRGGVEGRGDLLFSLHCEQQRVHPACQGTEWHQLLCWSPRAAGTKYHEPGGLRQKTFICSSCWRPEGGSWGASLHAAGPAPLVPWPAAQHPALPLLSHDHLPSGCASVSQPLSPYESTHHWLGAPPNPV